MDSNHLGGLQPTNIPKSVYLELAARLLCIGLSSKGGTFSAQCTPERFGMIGMDICLCNGTSCLRMFPPKVSKNASQRAFFVPVIWTS